MDPAIHSYKSRYPDSDLTFYYPYLDKHFKYHIFEVDPDRILYQIRILDNKSSPMIQWPFLAITFV